MASATEQDRVRELQRALYRAAKANPKRGWPNAGGEERRRAVCGRTACTDRGGGGRKPGQSAMPHGAGASRRPYIELSRRRVYLAGITANPDGAWVEQQARNLTMTLAEKGQSHRILVRDRDSKFTAAFDEVFRSEGLRVIKAPIAAPRAKAHAERWVGSARRECLDQILIVSRRQLETVLREYVAYYNTHRPHRSLDQHPPLLKMRPVPRRDRIGGLLHEYELAA